MTTDSPPSPESEPPFLPDDEWDRFLDDSERDIRATAPKEPSARARIVARRLREEDERQAAQGRSRPAARSSHRPWRTARRLGRSETAGGGPGRGERIRTVVALLAMALLALVLLAPHQAWSLVTGKGWHTAPGPAPTTQVPQTGPPPTAPGTPASPQTSTRPPLEAAPGGPGLPYASAARTIVVTPAPAYPLPEVPRPR